MAECLIRKPFDGKRTHVMIINGSQYMSIQYSVEGSFFLLIDIVRQVWRNFDLPSVANNFVHISLRINFGVRYTMRKIIRDLILKVNLIPSNYGTHSPRSGGTSESFIVGHGATFIKTFNW